MRPYIFGARSGIYIVDLQQTMHLFKTAYKFIEDTVAGGKSVLFVGTKKQAAEAIYEESTRCGMYYVNHRWLGGMLTNYATIKKSVDRLKHLLAIVEDGSISMYTKKEALEIEKETARLSRNLSGIKDMDKLPGALFVVDPKREAIAVREANKLKIPVVAIVDTNCDPDVIDYLIPGNDDAIRAIRLFSSKMSDACLAGLERREETLKAAKDEAEEEELKDMEVEPEGPSDVEVEIIS
jgi:small subunit ribosomal protein S2